jgi:hypothetical protein
VAVEVASAAVVAVVEAAVLTKTLLIQIIILAELGVLAVKDNTH